MSTPQGASSTTSKSSQATSKSSQATEEAKAVSLAKAQLAKYQGNPKFVAPGPAFNIKQALAGKKIFEIPGDSANPFNTTIDTGLQALAKTIGFSLTVYHNEGQSSSWQQAVDQAISEHASLINFTSGADPRQASTQVAAAIKDGIAVVSSHFMGLHQAALPHLSASLAVNYRLAGKLLADEAIVHTGGKADALIETSDEVYSTPSEVGGMKSTFATLCPNTCKTRTTNTPIADWATGIQPNIQSLLEAHHDINMILPEFDSASPYVVAGIMSANASNRVGIASYNGTPSILNLVREGKVTMDVGEDLDWAAYAIVDIWGRVLGKVSPFNSSNAAQSGFNSQIPFKIFTKQNVNAAGVPAQYNKGYGTAYIKGYDTLWGLG